MSLNTMLRGQHPAQPFKSKKVKRGLALFGEGWVD